MPVRRRSAVGAHVPTGGGLAATGLRRGRDIGAEVVQVFAGNPRAWSRTDGDPRQDEAFRDGCAADGIPVFVHAPYLVNLGSPSSTTRQRSVDALGHTLDRGRALGAAGVVVHAGSAVDLGGREDALGMVREALLPLLDAHAGYADGPRVLIEPTAGGGGSLAASVEQVGEYLEVLGGDERIGLCLDTCHAFAAGADLSRPGGVRRLLTALVRAAGPARLGLVHANDSRDPVGSGRDRHAGIGQGHIGEAAFGELFVHPAMRGVPVVVETPGDAQARDIATLQRLRDQPR